MQRRTAATPTLVCLLLRHDSARRPRWPSTTVNYLGRHLSGAQRSIQEKDFESILTVKMETRHPVVGPFGREFPAICNHCGVLTAWSRKTWKFCEQFLRFLKKWSLSNCRYCADRAQNLQGPAPHLAHIILDFIQIGSLSAELLPNAWRPFLSRRVFTI